MSNPNGIRSRVDSPNPRRLGSPAVDPTAPVRSHPNQNSGEPIELGVLTVPEAVEEITSGIIPRDIQRVPLLDALGRVLAAPGIAPYTLPQWDNSAMDGYAVRAADVAHATAENLVSLPVHETIAAGAFASRALRAGEAMRIMTGAPLPEGADTVIRVEDTDGGIERVTIRNARDVKKNIRPRDIITR